MKKLGIYFMMLAMTAVVFVGCNKDDDEIARPVITITGSSDYDLDKPEGFALEVIVTSDDEDLTSVHIWIISENKSTDILKKDIEKGKQQWRETFTAADFEDVTFVEGKSANFFVKVNTKSTDAEKSVIINVIDGGVVVEYLTAPAEFKLGRPAHGDYPASAMGIEWTSNPDGNTAKFAANHVMITATAYGAIETKEALEAAFDAGTKASDFTAKSDANFVTQYLIVKDGTTLRLVKMKSLNFVAGANKATFDEQH